MTAKPTDFCVCGHQVYRHAFDAEGVMSHCSGPSAENPISCWRCTVGGPNFEVFPLGYYQHYKGGVYEVLDVGVLSEDRHTPVVIYRSLKHQTTWVRPIQMFTAKIVTLEGVTVPRFRYMEGVKRMEDLWADPTIPEDEKVTRSVDLLRERFGFENCGKCGKATPVDQLYVKQFPGEAPVKRCPLCA